MSGVRSNRVPTNRRSRSSATVIQPPPRLSIPDEPPKVPRRPPSKGNKRETLADIAKRIPIQLMRLYFNYPLRAAAEAMHISVTTLKRLCRRHGVKRWPHRQISGINRALNDLEAQHQVAGNETDLSAVADQLRQLHRRREVIIELAFESDEESSRKTLNEDVPPAAHKRNQRSSTSADGLNPNTTSTTPASHTRSDSMDSTGSIDSPPESPGSVTSLDESKPTSVWWQHTPVAGDSLPPVNGEDDKTKVKNKGGRPRQPGSAASASSRGRAPRIQRTSSDLGNIVRTGGRDTPVGLSRRKSSPGAMISSGGGTSTSAASIAIANGGSTGGRKFAKPSSSSGPPFPSKRTGTNPGSRTVATNKVPAYIEMSVATAAAAAAAGRAGGNVFEQNTSVNQQMDDLAALGDLLFGPDDIAATADLKATGAHTGIFSPNASQWAPCAPFSAPEIFPQDQSLFGVASTSSSSTNDLGWGALVGDRNMLGMPTNVGLL